MAMVINTNVASINSQRRLTSTNNMLSTSMERLSSGLRVNSAKDDAAGLAIANGMDSQIRGMGVAVRNANDGISMAQTAEAAMGELTNTLQRMRDLAVQSANRGAVSDSDREKLQTEFSQLNDKFLLTSQKLMDLRALINKYYRDKLNPKDLFDIELPEREVGLAFNKAKLETFQTLFPQLFT